MTTIQARKITSQPLNETPSLHLIEKRIQGDNKRPWENSDGTLKKDSELKVISQKWSASVWEQYLKSTETYRRESNLPEPEMAESLSPDESIVVLYSLSKDPKYPAMRLALNACISELPKQQRQIINLVFWNNLSQREIAKKLEVSRTLVQMQLRRAKNKLKDMLLTGKVVRYSNGLKDLLAQATSQE